MKKLVLIVAGVIFAVLLTSMSEFFPGQFTYIGIAEDIQKGKTFKIPLKTRRDTYDPHDYWSFDGGYESEQLETDLDSTSSANDSTESVSPAKGENTDVKENKDATTSEQTTEEKTEETKPEA